MPLLQSEITNSKTSTTSTISHINLEPLLKIHFFEKILFFKLKVIKLLM